MKIGRSSGKVTLIVGDVVTDTVVWLTDPIASGADAEATVVDMPGGQAGNVAAWLGNLGVDDVHLLCAMSRADSFDHRTPLEQVGVIACIELVDAPPARIVCVVSPDRSERSFLTQRGASEFLSPVGVATIRWDEIDWCHVSGYLLGSALGRETYADIRDRCEARGIPLSIDAASSSEISKIGPREWLQVVGEISVLKLNEQEALALTGFTEPTAAAQVLLHSAKNVVITLGARGAAGFSVAEFVYVDAPHVQHVDPTGAGDAFTAGLLAALTRGETLHVSISEGVASGACAVQQRGGRP